VSNQFGTRVVDLLLGYSDQTPPQLTNKFVPEMNGCASSIVHQHEHEHQHDTSMIVSTRVKMKMKLSMNSELELE
jgi:hypothetical protein